MDSPFESYFNYDICELKEYASTPMLSPSASAADIAGNINHSLEVPTSTTNMEKQSQWTWEADVGPGDEDPFRDEWLKKALNQSKDKQSCFQTPDPEI